MKYIFLTLFLAVTIFTSSSSQSTTTKNEKFMENITSIFDKIEVQGVDTKQNLLYGYFFFDKDKSKLEKLKTELIKQAYSFVELGNRAKGQFLLHVEKIEQHTRQTLYNRELSLKQLANKFGVANYDGFDVSNADPQKPLISNENFIKFIKSQKGNDLYNLGIKLYDFEINDKAELVFKECIKQNIKQDTSSYKLGNALLGLGKVDEGIRSLEQATRFNPKYFNAFFNLAATCYDNEKFEKSILYYQQADKLKPNDDRIIYGIAASQFATKQFDKSLDNCKKALQLNSGNENAKTLLGMLKNKTH